jgi:hypothetical protein
VYSAQLGCTLPAARNQVRRWDSWYRWTRNEITRLLATLITRPARDTRHHLRWSAWRRRHQHRARTCHYQRQARQL